MTGESIKNRGLVFFGAILIQLALGALSAWSLFTKSLKEAPYNFSIAQTQAIFTAAIVTFTIVMIFAGIQMKKYGPRLLTITVSPNNYDMGNVGLNTFIKEK